ncbi:hypothetical protein D1AOALGA4SA_6377 [Olavius algarvensis Delta 1 endosymbiont]|nr:hypothetical protein D1AOALGA4SA_6377 [Olavius algarvensis Delta 1 endosymbiont]
MITKEIIKSEIDNLKDEYLEILYRIIKAFEIPVPEETEKLELINKHSEWHNFTVL